MMAEGHGCKWFSYLQLFQSSKIHKRVYGTEYCKTEFEIDLGANGDVIAKRHKLLKQKNKSNDV